MRVYKFNKFTYTIDFPVLFLFVGVFLDIVSTFLFVALNIGRESHPILGGLISISIWFIPFYLFITNAFFVPFLPDILRKTLSYTIGLSGFLFGMNNFSLVLFSNAFLVDTIGYNPMIILFFLFGLILFVYLVKIKKLNNKEILNLFLKLLFYIVFLGLIHSLFVVITWLPFIWK